MGKNWKDRFFHSMADLALEEALAKGEKLLEEELIEKEFFGEKFEARPKTEIEALNLELRSFRSIY